MSEVTKVCSKCGAEMAQHESELKMEEGVPCEDGSFHDWSDDDPMSRALARMASSTFEAEVVDSSDGGEWQWFEMALRDHDVVGASEAMADCAQAEGFSFVGLGKGDDPDGPATVRFNRKK